MIDVQTIKKSLVFDDDFILQGKPLELTKYGKKITIKQINYFYKWNDFIKTLGTFLQYCNMIVGNIKFPDNKITSLEAESVYKFLENIKLTLNNKQAKKAFEKICTYSGLSKWWMRRNFSINDYVEIFLYVFFFNIVLTTVELHNVLKVINKKQSSTK
jgi:hypothetical protein